MEKKKLLDEELESISGGLETIGKRRTAAYDVNIQCPYPDCKHVFNQIFYTDGSMQYEKCPKCHREIGKG